MNERKEPAGTRFLSAIPKPLPNRSYKSCQRYCLTCHLSRSLLHSYSTYSSALSRITRRHGLKQKTIRHAYTSVFFWRRALRPQALRRKVRSQEELPHSARTSLDSSQFWLGYCDGHTTPERGRRCSIQSKLLLDASRTALLAVLLPIRGMFLPVI